MNDVALLLAFLLLDSAILITRDETGIVGRVTRTSENAAVNGTLRNAGVADNVASLNAQCRIAAVPSATS